MEKPAALLALLRRDTNFESSTWTTDLMFFSNSSYVTVQKTLITLNFELFETSDVQPLLDQLLKELQGHSLMPLSS